MKPSLRRLVRAGFAAALFALAATAALAQTLYVSNWGVGAGTTIYKATAGGSGIPFATGLSGPLGLAFGPDGFLYVANDGGGTLSKVASNGTVSSFGSSVVQPKGLAFDASGDLFVASAGLNKVVTVASNGATTDFATGLNTNPAAMALLDGTLYAATISNPGKIYKVTSAGVVSLWSLSGSSLNNPYGLAFDTAGTLYVANYSGNSISKVTAAGVVSTWSTSGSALSNPMGLTFAANGNLLVANSGANNVLEITPAGVASVFASGFNAPAGVAFAPAAIPEPSTFAALAGLTALGAIVWRRRKVAKKA